MPQAPHEEASASGASDEREEHEVTARDLRSALIMGAIFVGSILLAMAMAETLQGSVPPVVENPEDPTNPLLYLGLVVVFTLGLLLAAKLGFDWIIQAVILGAIFVLMAVIYEPLIGAVTPLSATLVFGLSLSLAGLLTLLLYVYPEWYVVDAVGISVAAGATGWFGFSFGLVPALILLVAFAAYDAIAVYRTEHMLDLADQVMGLQLPIMLVVPKTLDYSFLDEARDEETEQDTGEDVEEGDEPNPEQTDGEEPAAGDPAAEDTAGGDPEEDGAREVEDRDALFMGLGDIVIPGVLVVSSLVFLGEHTASASTVLGLSGPLFVALCTLAGATVGFGVLMRGVLKGSPHAGLPALNGGALIGFLAPTLWLYGWVPLIPTL